MDVAQPSSESETTSWLMALHRLLDASTDTSMLYWRTDHSFAIRATAELPFNELRVVGIVHIDTLIRNLERFGFERVDDDKLVKEERDSCHVFIDYSGAFVPFDSSTVPFMKPRQERIDTGDKDEPEQLSPAGSIIDHEERSTSWDLRTSSHDARTQHHSSGNLSNPTCLHLGHRSQHYQAAAQVVGKPDDFARPFETRHGSAHFPMYQAYTSTYRGVDLYDHLSASPTSQTPALSRSTSSDCSLSPFPLYSSQTSPWNPSVDRFETSRFPNLTLLDDSLAERDPEVLPSSLPYPWIPLSGPYPALPTPPPFFHNLNRLGVSTGTHRPCLAVSQASDAGHRETSYDGRLFASTSTSSTRHRDPIARTQYSDYAEVPADPQLRREDQPLREAPQPFVFELHPRDYTDHRIFYPSSTSAAPAGASSYPGRPAPVASRIQTPTASRFPFSVPSRQGEGGGPRFTRSRARSPEASSGPLRPQPLRSSLSHSHPYRSPPRTIHTRRDSLNHLSVRRLELLASPQPSSTPLTRSQSAASPLSSRRGQAQQPDPFALRTSTRRSPNESIEKILNPPLSTSSLASFAGPASHQALQPFVLPPLPPLPQTTTSSYPSQPTEARSTTPDYSPRARAPPLPVLSSPLDLSSTTRSQIVPLLPPLPLPSLTPLTPSTILTLRSFGTLSDLFHPRPVLLPDSKL